MFNKLNFPVIFGCLGLLQRLLIGAFGVMVKRRGRCVRAPEVVGVGACVIVVDALMLLTNNAFFCCLLRVSGALTKLPFEKRLTGTFLKTIAPHATKFYITSVKALAAKALVLALVLVVVNTTPVSANNNLGMAAIYITLLATRGTTHKGRGIRVHGHRVSPRAVHETFTAVIFCFY